jgi:hypothetical protein
MFGQTRQLYYSLSPFRILRVVYLLLSETSENWLRRRVEQTDAMWLLQNTLKCGYWVQLLQANYFIHIVASYNWQLNRFSNSIAVSFMASFYTAYTQLEDIWREFPSCFTGQAKQQRVMLLINFAKDIQKLKELLKNPNGCIFEGSLSSESSAMFMSSKFLRSAPPWPIIPPSSWWSKCFFESNKNNGSQI